MKKVAIGLLSLLIAVTARVGMAQTIVSGALTGTVTDHTGAAVPGAQVTVKSASTGALRTTTTNGVGTYRANLLPPGTYVVTAQVAGFTASENLASVSVGEWTFVDIQLNPNASPQAIVVSSEDPPTADWPTDLDYWYPELRMYPFPRWARIQR